MRPKSVTNWFTAMPGRTSKMRGSLNSARDPIRMVRYRTRDAAINRWEIARPRLALLGVGNEASAVASLNLRMVLNCDLFGLLQRQSLDAFAPEAAWKCVGAATTRRAGRKLIGPPRSAL